MLLLTLLIFFSDIPGTSLESRIQEYNTTKKDETYLWRLDRIDVQSFIPKVDLSFFGLGLYDEARKGNGIFEIMIKEGLPINSYLKGEVNIGIFWEVGDGQEFLPYYDPLIEPRYIIHNFETQPVIENMEFDVRTEKAYLLFENEDISIGVGRNRLKIGPGYRSNLLISGRGQPLDFLYNASVKKGPLKLYVFNADIEDSTGTKRIACQRMELHLSHFTIGLTEAVLHKNENFLKYINPLEFYYITQRRGANNEDNLVASTYVTFTKGGRKYYLEILFDDPRVFSDGPFKAGVMLGVYLTDPFSISPSDFRIEATVVPRWTYTHEYSNHSNTLSANGFPLGFFGGPDCIDIYAEFTKYMKNVKELKGQKVQGSYLSFILEYLAHGDGKLDIGWKQESNDFPEPKKIRIPSGCVEKRIRVGVEGNINFDVFSISIGTYVEKINNYTNIDGNNITRASIKTVINFNIF